MTLLLDRVVLVSGGTHALGAAVAAGAVRAGARVVVLGRRPWRAVAGATHLSCDIADVGEARAAVAATVAVNGRVDGLVNAAGLAGAGTLLDTRPEAFDRQVAVNLRGPLFLMQAAVADMLRRGAGGSIVNVIPEPGGPSHSAARAGLIALTDDAARVHRADRIVISGTTLPAATADTVLRLLSLAPA